MVEITIRQALEDYKSVYMPYRNFAERTREEYTNDLKDFIGFTETAAISKVPELNVPIIHRYVARLEQRGFSSLTRKRKVVAIRSFLLFLYQDEYIHTDLAAKVVLPFAETRAPCVLTRTECDQLRQACAAHPRDAAIVEVLLRTGIGLSELARLTLNDIDWLTGKQAAGMPRGHIRIAGSRGRKGRMVPLDLPACVKLQKYLSTNRNANTAAVFLNRFGNPFGERGVQKMLRKYLEGAGIGATSVRTLRHTFAVVQLAKGVDRKSLQEEMGLRDMRSTAVYTILRSQQARGCVGT